jgi:serine/threonine protein kinase
MEASRAKSEKSVKVSDYSVGETIGSGSFGQVRLAFHQRLKLPFAVKVITKKTLAAAKHGKSTMFNEMILAPLLDYPSIISVVDIADSSGFVFQFMQLAEHGDLLHRLRTAPLEHPLALRLIDQILGAVEYLHSLGICHRDIKLENVLLTRSAGVKLCDFGLAAITFDGIVKGGCGSFEYSAPEIITAPRCDGFKADMWSVGVVIYAIFARALPFKNITRDFNFEAAVVDYSRVPPVFRPWIEQFLSIDPDRRPHASEARGFPPLNSTQVRKKAPFSGIPTDLDLTDSTELVSRLSQVLRMQFDQLVASLRSPKITVEKLLFALFQKKMSNRSGEPLFRGSCRSLPLPESSAMTIRVSFPGCSADVFRRLHSVTMGQRCYVSSPITMDPVIVQTTGPTDRRIAFNCVDDGNAKQSVLTLVLPEDAGDLADLIMAQMQAAFTP